MTTKAIAHDIKDRVVEVSLQQKPPDDSAKTPHEMLFIIERRLHRVIRDALEAEYGEENDTWWRKGVPLEVRKKCATRREEEDDDSPKHLFQFVDLIDLPKIIEKQWRILEPCMQAAADLFPSKGDWAKGIQRLNRVRKKDAHPARLEDIVDSDRELLDEFYQAVHLLPVSEEVDEVVEDEVPEWRRRLMEITGEVDD